MNFLSKILIIIAGSLALSACDTTATQPGPAASPVTRIVSTTSFGMCSGYCRTRLELTETQFVLIREPGGRGAPNLPAQRFTATPAAGEWQQLATLAASAPLAGLPETIGCPDCADGGAESLAISGTGGEKKVTFDHGADIRELQPLMTRVRDIRTRLAPKE
jgi:hypothetical protein